MTQKQPLFSAEKIVKQFGRITALKNVDLRCDPGELIAVFGINGAGKSTLLKISAGILKATGGKVLISGVDTKKDALSIRKMTGFIAHETFLYNKLTAYENLRFFSSLYSLDNPGERIDDILHRVGLYKRKNDVVNTFSRGMQQRLAIARAFLHEPRLIFLDEPYTGLDAYASEMLNTLIESMKEESSGGIMTTHNLDQGYDLATHIAVLHRGTLQYFAERKDISKESFKATYFRIISEK